MSFTLKEILESSRERGWSEAGISKEDIAFSRLIGIDARDVGSLRAFTRRDLLIVVRCPKRDARIWHGILPPKNIGISAKTGEAGVVDRIFKDGRRLLFVSDYDLMSVWRHDMPSFRKIFISAAKGAKQGAWSPEAQSVIRGLNQVLVSRIQHGCQDDFQSSRNPGVKDSDHFAAFRLGMATYLPTFRECARYYHTNGLTPWPYDAGGMYVGPKLS